MSHPLCMKMTIVFGSLPSKNQWHRSLASWMKFLSVTMGTGPHVNIRQQAAESKQLINEERQGSEWLGLTKHQDVSLSWGWHFHYVSPQDSQFLWGHVLGEGEKKTAISNWLNCQMLAAGVMESALVYKISCGLLETNTATTKPRIPCITEVLFILSFLPSVCLNRKIAMRIKMLPAHVGLIYSLISACILPPAPTTYAECI